VGYRLWRFLETHILNHIDRKLIAASLIAILVPLLGTALYGNWITSRVLREQAISGIQLDLKQRASRVETYLEGVRQNVLYLSHSPEIQALIQARMNGDVETVERIRDVLNQEFAAFAATHPVYYQIRYIAEDGREVVRVNARNGVIEAVPPKGLQNKAHRYYFREAMRLQEGEIYMSPLDLNREFGQIERPYTPVIRYATPVFYPDGRRAGIVIVNLFAEKFLQYITAAAGQGLIAMVDKEGYYLVHPDPSRLWGHPRDLGTGYRLTRDFPKQWPQILTASPGVTKDSESIVVHHPIFPNQPNEDYFWIVLQAIPTHVLFASVRSFRVTAVTILLMAVLAGVTMAAFLGRSITAPILMLTDRVRRFGRGEPYVPVHVVTNDEMGELTRAFNDMARRLESNMERLARLTYLGQRIAAQLDHENVLAALLDATDELFPSAQYRVVRLNEPDHDVWMHRGDPEWEEVCHLDVVELVREQVLREHAWRSVHIPLEDGRTVYMCSAFLECRTHGIGVVELYGEDPGLATPSTGNLLATLAVQASIALENAHLYRTLDEHRARLQTLVEQLITAQEEERRIVAYDLHDGLVQRLVGARLQLMNFLSMYTPSCAESQVALDKAVHHLTTAIVEARRVIEGLRPGLLDDLGLVPALEYYAQELGADAGWEVHLDVPLEFPRLPSIVEVTAFRIAQEALNNVRKYANAKRVWITARLEDGWLELSIRDDGSGFDVEQTQESGHVFGILGMQERAHLLGGECEIHSAPGQGTTVTVRLPVETGNDELTSNE